MRFAYGQIIKNGGFVRKFERDLAKISCAALHLAKRGFRASKMKKYRAKLVDL